jgi:hypothetical protein
MLYTKLLKRRISASAYCFFMKKKILLKITQGGDNNRTGTPISAFRRIMLHLYFVIIN